MIDGFTIALLTAEFGQVWAKLGLRESRTTLGEIARQCIALLYISLLNWKCDGRHEIAHH